MFAADAFQANDFGKKTFTYPDYEEETKICASFIRHFSDANAGDPSQKLKYLAQIQSIVDRKSKVFELSLDDVSSHCGDVFTDKFLTNTLRYTSLMYESIDKCIAETFRTSDSTLRTSDPYERYQDQRETKWNQIRESIIQQRRSIQRDGTSNEEADNNAVPSFPVELTRRYEIQIIPSQHSLDKPTPMRSIRASSVGHTVTVRGIVTRVTDVAPLVRVVTYICYECGWETYQPVNDRVFTPLKKCPSATCTTNHSDGSLQQQARGSRFVRFQSVKLQEMGSEVPIGAIPRQIQLRMYGSMTRVCKPGDMITVTGVFLPTPYTGFRAMRAGLTADTYVEVYHVHAAKKTYKQSMLGEEALQHEASVNELAQSKDLYERLSESIAPEIYGHSDIKKALLLLLTSGVTTTLADGLRIRGDINMLLMGDPGVAKSQLLKHIAHIAPRAVYTTGKGSSGVGLTAAVMRDPISGDMTLEGGSLVLADMGICCIDEFDKMEESDRSSIHEVMEQQTVSIAKAGITTTLNARTSVLAAANPVYGRWRPSLPIEANLGLPTSLLSRFDLSFIMLDRPNHAHDTNLAAHVAHVHMFRQQPEMDFEPVSASVIRAYISQCRQHTPTVPVSLTDDIVAYYVGVRNDDTIITSSRDPRGNERQRFATPRSLLSVLRLAQAHARLHMRDVVNKEDVDEAIRLMIVSLHSSDDNEESEGQSRKRDPIGEIFDILRSQRSAINSNTLIKSRVYPMVLAKGYTVAEWEQCLREYEALNVWMVKPTTITFILQNENFSS